LSQATFGTYHAEERNCVLVAGQGEEDARVLVTRSNPTRYLASKWNRREYFVSIHASTREATARFGIRMPDHPHILPLFYPDFFLSSLFNSKFTLISREPQPVSMLTSGSHL
jgi:hypothetical protein